MTAAMVYVILVLAIPLALVFMNRLREDIAALVMVAALMIAQIAGLPVLGPTGNIQSAELALRGFGSTTILTLIALFIITTSLEKYGLTSWISRKLVEIGGKSERRLIGLYSLTATLISMVMINLAAGALLLPSALETSRRAGIKPSKLLLPISIGTMLGGAAFYLSTANIIISGLLPSANPPLEPLGILDFTLTGGLVALVGVIFLTIFGKKLLPDREPPYVYKIPGSRGLTGTYQLQERLWEVGIPEDSEINHKTLAEANLGKNLGISIIAVRRNQRILPTESANFMLEAGDTLVIIGREERVSQLEGMGLEIRQASQDTSFESSDLIFAEAIIPPHSDTEGKTLREIAFRARCGFSAIALWRDNRSYRTDVAEFCLKAGDALLLIGPAENIRRLRQLPDVLVVETAVNRNGMDKPRILQSSGIVAASLLAMILGVPIYISMITAAVILLLSRLVTMEEAYQSIKWRALFLIAGIMSVSAAMFHTGLANLIGDAIIQLVSPLGGIGLAGGAILVTALLSQLMGSQIAPLVTGPVFISAAVTLGVDPHPIAVVTGISTAIFFLTPLSHPVHLIMMSPANYEYKDFLKIGAWMSLVCFVSLLFAVKIFWAI
jgi:di/tricarboxylate transporter